MQLEQRIARELGVDHDEAEAIVRELTIAERHRIDTHLASVDGAGVVISLADQARQRLAARRAEEAAEPVSEEAAEPV